jgi:hypothetical protein
VGQDSSFGIGTRYGVDGPVIESLWSRDFPRPPRPALGPTQPNVGWVLGSLSRISWGNAWENGDSVEFGTVMHNAVFLAERPVGIEDGLSSRSLWFRPR